jgi:hypothetical protein
MVSMHVTGHKGNSVRVEDLTSDEPRSWQSLLDTFNTGNDARWRGVPKPLGDRVVSINIARVHEAQLRARDTTVRGHHLLPTTKPADEVERRI